MPKPTGQGERGAPRHEDHGSELTFEGGHVIGGLKAGHGGEPEPEPSGDLEVPHEQWTAFLDSFSRQHLNWLASIETASPAGRLDSIEEHRLRGVIFDQAQGRERACIQMGEAQEGEVTHTVNVPTRIIFRQSETGAHQGLEIISAEGSTTVLRFRSAAHPEALDGLAA